MRSSLPFPAETFVKYLSRQQRDGFTNPWAGESEGATARRAALVTHLRITAPRFIVLGEHARVTDAAVTGVPLASEYAAQNGMVPRLAPPTEAAGQMPALDPLSSELWRGLNLLRIAPMALCFVAIPLVPDHRPVRDERAYVELFDWARSLIEWYPDIGVIALGSKVHRLCELMGIAHAAIYPPDKRRMGLVDQLIEVVDTFTREPVPAVASTSS